ncbi:hypothetical protein ACTQW9_15860 [Lachnospiraceae bacterium LCP19S3_B12]
MSKKKLLVIIMTLILTLGLCTSAIYASNPTDQRIINREVIYYPDGSSLETIIYLPLYSTYDSNTITATKRATYRTENEARWSVSVTGSFTYTGRSSLCTSSSVAAESYSPNWRIIDKSSSYSRNQATGTGIAEFFVGPTVVATKSLSVILECDIDGNLK